MYEGRKKITLNKKQEKPEVVNEKPDSNVSETEAGSKIPNQEEAEKSEALSLVDELTEKDTKTFDSVVASRDEKVYKISEENIDKLGKIFSKKVKDVCQHIDINDFVDIYGKEVVEKDQEDLNNDENGIDNENSKNKSGKNPVQIEKDNIKHKTAKIFENLFPILVDKNSLLGPDATSILTARVEDVSGPKIDNIIEFAHGDGAYSHLGIGIDLTVGNKDTIQKKINGIENGLKNGNLSTVKYFESKKMHIKGQYKNMPKVIVTGSTNTVLDLMQLQILSERGDNRIDEYRFQFQALEEVLLQLQYFINYVGDSEIKDKLNVTLYKVRGVLEQKIINIGADKYTKIRGTYDRGYYALKEVLDETFNIDKYIYKNS